MTEKGTPTFHPGCPMNGNGLVPALSEKALKLISSKKCSSIMLRLLKLLHNGGAKDGKIEMSLGLSSSVAGVERLVVGRVAWIAIAGGRRTVTIWLHNKSSNQKVQC